MNFKLFLHKTYINNIFCTKYLNEHLGVMIKECVSHSKDHDFSPSSSIKISFGDLDNKLKNKKNLVK